MARAYSIFILRRQDTRTIIRAWTVKHEMVTWLNQDAQMCYQDIEMECEVIRMVDGKIGCETIVPWKEIPWT